MRLETMTLPLIDVHCHAVTGEYREIPAVDHLARLVSVGAMGDGNWPGDQARGVLFFKRLVRELARLFACEADAEAVLAIRNDRTRASHAGYVQELFDDAGLELLVVETGYPPDPGSFHEFQTLTTVPMRPVVRIEQIAEVLGAGQPGFAEMLRRFDERVDEEIRGGAVGLKSIIAFTTGLEVERISLPRAEAEYPGFLRGQPSKTFNDFLFHRAAGLCVDREMPLQVHAGMGPGWLKLATARPALLQAFLQRMPDLRLVIIHGGYPWLQEAAIMANIYPRVWLDLSEWVPLLHRSAADRLLDVLAMAPLNRVVYGSDGYAVPELHWMGARIGREAVSKAIATLAGEGLLGEAEALAAAGLILAGNARELYGGKLGTG